MSDEEIDDATYEAEMNAVYDLCPKSLFSISIPLSKMNDILTTKPSIEIHHHIRCRCYKSKRLHIYPITLQEMSYKNIINELIKQGLHPRCDHRFLEAFIRVDDNIYNMFFGS
jgi:hypothetical protein